MHKLPFVFAVPAIAIIIVVAAAAVVKMKGEQPVETTMMEKTLPSSFTQSQDSSAAGSGGFGAQLKTVGTADLSHDLTTTVDDGGQADLDALLKDTAGL